MILLFCLQNLDNAFYGAKRVMRYKKSTKKGCPLIRVKNNGQI